MRTSPRSIFKNATALMAANVFNLLGSFVLTFFIARMLQVTGFGIYATVFLFVTMTSIVSGLGISNYITRELARDVSQTNRYFMHGFVITGMAALLFGVILWLIIPLFGYEPETMLGVKIIAFSLLPTAVGGVFDAIYITHQRSEFILWINLIELAGKIAVSLTLLFSGYGPIALIVTFVLFRYVALAGHLFFMFRYIFRPAWEFDLHFALKILNDLRTFAALQVLTGSFDQIEIVFLSIFHGETAVGVYAAAFKLITLWNLLPENFMRVMFPLFSQAHTASPDQFHRFQEKSTRYLMAMAMPLLAGTIVCADSIIHFFYGDGYTASIPTLRILSLMIGIIFLEEILWRILVARDRQDAALKAQIAGISGRVFFALLLIPAWSYIGTAWAMVIAFSIHTLIHIYYVHKVSTPLPLLRLSWRYALAAVGMGVVLYFLNPHLPLLVTVSIGAVIYTGLVWLLKGFTAEDFDLLRRILHPRLEEAATAPTPGE
ncbi:MAG: flippase [Chloroflexi bacterium]|nr:MAG: flippase [Chloroflexota bacterium]